MKVLFTWLLMAMTCHASSSTHDQLCLKQTTAFLRHPHDCQKFIRCHYQRAYEFQCPAGLLWHHDMKTCNFSYRTACKLYGQSAKENGSKYLQKNVLKKNKERKYEENLAPYNFGKRVKRFTNTKRKCRKFTREYIKANNDVKPTVKTVTERMLNSSTVKLTEQFETKKAKSTESPKSSIIAIDNSKPKILNHRLMDTNFTKFSENTTKNLPDASTLQTFTETTIESQNTIFPKAVQNNSVELTETILNGYSAQSSFVQQQISFAELQSHSLNINGITDSSSVETTSKENESTILTTKYPEKLRQSFSKTIDCVKPTESVIKNHYLEKSTQTIAVNLAENLNLLSESFLDSAYSTDKSSIKTTNEEKDINNEENLWQSSTKTDDLYITTYFLNDTKLSSYSLNSADTKSTSYSTESSIQMINTTIPEYYTSSLLLPTTLKILSIGSATSSIPADSSLIETTEVENDHKSLIATIYSYTENPSSFANFETIAEQKNVNLTETTLAIYNKENSTLNYDSISEGTLTELKTSTTTPDTFTEIFSNITTVNLSDSVTENISSHTKYAAYLFQSTESSRESSDSKTLRGTALLTTADQSTVTLTESALADYPVENVTSSFYSSTQQKKINSDNLKELQILPAASSEISKTITDSIELYDYSTAELTDTESVNIIELTTESSVNFSEKFNFTYNISIFNESELTISQEDYSVNLTEEFLTSTSTVRDNTVNRKIEEITEKSDILQDFTTLKENTFSVTEEIINIKTTEEENKSSTEETENLYVNDNLGTVAVFSDQGSVSTLASLTETVTEMSTKNVNDMNLADVIETSNNYKDLPTFDIENLSNLLSKSKSTTSAISTILPNHFPHFIAESKSTTSAISTSLHSFPYDGTTLDPRLPFRSIECQGSNNRRQLKAQKCYQYYQCFAGWAFLLNCHEGWRFQANKEQCVLDVNQECDSE